MNYCSGNNDVQIVPRNNLWHKFHGTFLSAEETYYKNKYLRIIFGFINNNFPTNLRNFLNKGRKSALF